MKTAKRAQRGMPDSVIQGTRILGRMSGRASHLYQSSKAGGVIALESPAEKTIAQLADIDPRVVSLRAQPFTIDVLTGAIYRDRDSLLAARKLRDKTEVKIREYTPDFLLETIAGRSVVVEVKYEKYLGDDTYWEKLQKAKNILQQNGYEFTVIALESNVGLPIVHNAGLLTAFLANYVGNLSLDQISTVEEQLNHGPRPLGELCNAIGISLRESPVLILRGIAKLDLSHSRLQAESQVIRSYGELAHLELLSLNSVSA